MYAEFLGLCRLINYGSDTCIDTHIEKTILDKPTSMVLNLKNCNEIIMLDSANKIFKNFNEIVMLHLANKLILKFYTSFKQICH